MERRAKIILLLAAMLLPVASLAQLSSNPDKFLGNITTSSNVNAGGGVPDFDQLWNQITCENESKWGSVEGSRGNFNWGCDNAFNYAKLHQFPHKFHALVWGSQYPNWLPNLTPQERLAALTNWYDHVKAKYNTLPLIDVVNEAVGMHQQGNTMMKETLGGGGKTGYDWVIKAFDMAGQRWPDAILIYNDYNSLRWDVDNYITLVQTLRDAGAPIDAYGNQSHEISDISSNELSNVLKKQQDALKMPMYITELDIDKANDEQQLAQYKKVLPLVWKAPYCAGVTLWGYVHGKTWVANSGLYRNGEERPAMTWIKEYMASDEAKSAASPFPGMQKEASVYIRPAALKVAQGDVLPIKIHASLAGKTIEKVDFYVGDELVKTLTEAPYIVEYTAGNQSGWQNTKAVVTATDGSTYERYGRFNVVSSSTKRKPYNGVVPAVPGTISVSDYDEGASGIAYYNTTRETEKTTKDGAWMEYTVDVEESGLYVLDATVAAAKSGGLFHLAEYGLDSLSFLTSMVHVPLTGGTTEWKKLHGHLTTPLSAGRHVFTLLIDKGDFCIKDITLSRYQEGEDMSCRQKAYSAEYGVGDVITLEAKTTSKNSPVSHVNFYADNLLVGTATSTESAFTCDFVPLEMGTYVITAIAVNEAGEVKESQTRSLAVTSPTPTAISTVASDVFDAPAYNLMGIPVGPDYRGIVIKNGKKYVVK